MDSLPGQPLVTPTEKEVDPVGPLSHDVFDRGVFVILDQGRRRIDSVQQLAEFAVFPFAQCSEFVFGGGGHDRLLSAGSWWAILGSNQ